MYFYYLASRLSHFTIDVSDNGDGSAAKQCDREDTGFAQAETRVYSCPPGILGKYVRIRFDSNKREHLQLCEVQVLGG